ncbi:hypothetical protein [Achromobacter aloeverae]
MQLATIPDPLCRESDLPLAWSYALAKRMRALYGSRFADRWGNVEPEELAAVWAQELHGFTAEDFRRGLDACRSLDWPPTLPEFMKLCRPWMVPETAFYDAVNGMSARRRGEVGNWPHPAVYWAAVTVGSHDLLNCGYAVLKGRWERALAAELAKTEWPAVPAPAPALAAPGQNRASREQAHAAAQEIRASAAAAVNQTGMDDKRWARKILAEQERKGGQRYSITVIAWAKRALGLTDTDEAQA